MAKEATVRDTLNKEGVFDLIQYSDNINEQIVYIKNKINTCEIKITSLKSKEEIISNIINRISNAINKATQENNYKMADINQSKILIYFESMSLIQEMLIKYEDMIQKYIKMIIDIENHKINAYVKIKAANKSGDKQDGEYDELIARFHEMTTNSKEQNTAMVDHVKKELQLEGY